MVAGIRMFCVAQGLTSAKESTPGFSVFSSPISAVRMCLVTGLAVRMPLSYLVVYGGGFTWKERLFFAIAWTPKVSARSP